MGFEQGCVFLETEDWEREFIEQRCAECERLVCYDRELDDAVLGEIGNARMLSIFIYSRITAEVLDRLPNLELITSRSTGYDHIDLDACRKRGITVCNVPEYGSNTVAEHTFALILALTRKIHKAVEHTARADFSQRGLRGIDLKGRTIGVVGTGDIGEHVCRIARGFAMKVLAFDVKPNRTLANQLEVEYTDLDDLVGRSDIVTLHCPHNEKTHHMINAERIESMQPQALLINTARGGLVDTRALLVALRENRIGGVGLDVLEGEQMVKEEKELVTERYDVEALRTLVQNHALLKQENAVVTPHMAFNSEEALSRILTTTIDNIHCYLEGRPQNVVAAPESPGEGRQTAE